MLNSSPSIDHQVHSADSSNNPLSFAEHVTPMYPELICQARQLARGDHARAEDVVQDSMIKAFRAWKNFVPEPGMLSVQHAVNCWLRRIVWNTFMKHYHAARRRPEVQMGALAVMREDGDDRTFRNTDVPGPDPRDELGEDRAGDEVREAIARLSPGHRRVVEMHYVDGVELEKIAVIEGVDRVTVRTRLHRARELMKKTLGAYAMEAYGFVDKKTPGKKKNRSGRAGHAALEPAEDLQPERRGVDRVVRRDDGRALLGRGPALHQHPAG